MRSVLGLRQGMAPDQRREVLEPHLEAHGSSADTRCPEPRSQPIGVTHQLLVDAVRIGEILLVGHLDGDRLGTATGFHRPRIIGIGESMEVAAENRPQPTLQQSDRQFSQVADGGDTEFLEAGEGHFADTPELAHTERMQELGLGSGGHEKHPVGLGSLAGQLGDQLGRCDSGGRWQSGLPPDPCPQCFGRHHRVLVVESKAGDVQERLIDGQPFHVRREGPQNRKDLPGGIHIGSMIGLDESGVWTRSPGQRHGHRRANSAPAGLVAGRRHHSAIAEPADDHGNPLELWITAPLNLHEKRIHVDVQDVLTKDHAGTVPAVLERLHLVRHGEVSNPKHVCYADLPGFVLSDIGRLQAAAAAGRLAVVEPGASVVSSPLERAAETAGIIAEALGSAVETDDRLTEFGLSRRWAGVVWEDLPERFPGELEAYLEHPHDLPFAPESLGDVAQRMREAIESISATSAVVVSHQDPVQAVRLALTGRPLEAVPFDKPGHAEIISLVRRGTGWLEIERWQAPVGGVVNPQRH